MSNRSSDVVFAVIMIALVTGILFMCASLAGCAAMEPWLKPAAAATTQAVNGSVGEAVKPLIPPPGREIIEAVGLIAALIVGHYNGKKSGAREANAAGLTGTAPPS